MNFAEKLRKLMGDLGISQTKLSGLTGINKSSISQYLSGKNEPARERKREIARALGVQEDYFEALLPEVKLQNDVFNLPAETAARLMGKSAEWVYKGLQDARFPWGWAVLNKRWSYYISSKKFEEYTGIKIPVNEAGVAS